MPSRSSKPPSANSRLFGTSASAAAGTSVGVGGTFKITTDGGSRGNPGPAAAGAVVDGHEVGEYLVHRTNNYAEYYAILMALKKAKALLGKDKAKRTAVEVQMDSELAVRQLNHEYKINDPDIQRFFLEIWNLMLDFKSVTFAHIFREANTAADAVVNKVLDAHRD